MSDARWPEDWDERMAGKDCVMCANQGEEDNGYGLRFLEGSYADVFLQRRQRLGGYSVAIWKTGHVADPVQLTDEQNAGYWLDVVRAARILQQHFRPAKMNYSTFGNALPHLHTHLVPRYIGDPAPGAPMPMNALLTAPVSNEPEFVDSVAALRRGLGAMQG